MKRVFNELGGMNTAITSGKCTLTPTRARTHTFSTCAHVHSHENIAGVVHNCNIATCYCRQHKSSVADKETPFSDLLSGCTAAMMKGMWVDGEERRRGTGRSQRREGKDRV